jgi:uncharacterized protein (DUF433 family)
MQMSKLLERITHNPGIMGGKPIIRGMRFGVNDVLSYMAGGMTVGELLEDFPYLEREDIQACLIFAANIINHPVIHIETDAA